MYYKKKVSYKNKKSYKKIYYNNDIEIFSVF